MSIWHGFEATLLCSMIICSDEWFALGCVDSSFGVTVLSWVWPWISLSRFIWVEIHQVRGIKCVFSLSINLLRYYECLDVAKYRILKNQLLINSSDQNLTTNDEQWNKWAKSNKFLRYLSSPQYGSLSQVTNSRVLRKNVNLNVRKFKNLHV